MQVIVRRTALAIIISALFFTVVAGSVYSGQVAEDSWVSKAPMHVARIALSVAAVNGKIYAIGGIDSIDGIDYSSLAINEEYDPTINTWTYKTPMPTPRSFFAIAVYQNKIYCIGGKPSESADNPNAPAIGVNEAYDPATDTWQILKPMPTARMDLQANVINGKIYLIGGRVSDVPDYNSTIFNLNEAYDPLTGTWITKAPMPQAATAYISGVVNDKIYVITPSLIRSTMPKTTVGAKELHPLLSISRQE